MIAICLLFLSVLPQDDSKPLPDQKSFLAEFRRTLHTDNVLLSQYTYTEKRTHMQLDSNSQPKKTDVEIYQVTRGADAGSLYRRRVSKNGVDGSSAKPESVRRAGRRDDENVIDDVFGVYDIQFTGRQEINGRPTIHLTFKPRADYKPKTRQGTFMQHIAGEAWVDETDHELARIDAQVIDTISIGFGLLAKLQKGARVQALRQKINGEVWVPLRTEAHLTGRMLLFKGINTREIAEYSDYEKFSVDTILKFPDENK
jgi:hypothetical protein